MLRHARNRSTLLAVAGIATVFLWAARPASAQGIYSPGPVFGDLGTRLFPFEFAIVGDFRSAPSRPADPRSVTIDSINWARGTFDGSLALWVDFNGGPAAKSRATTGQIRPLSNGYEVTFIARKPWQQTNFVGRLSPTELVINGVRQWVLEGQYTYSRSLLLCGVGEPCGTIGPFPCRLQGWVR